MITYALTIDEKFLEEFQDRVRAHGAARFGRYGLKLICLLGLSALLALFLWAKAWLVAPIPVVFIALVLVGPKFDYWLAKRRFRKSPFYRQFVKATLEVQGYTEVCDLSSHTIAWAAFTKVVRMPDGYLLGIDPKQWQWLPDCALVTGSVAEVDQFLRERVTPNAG